MIRSAFLGFGILLGGSWLAAQESALPLGWERISLPPLRVAGQPARAHTQGLETVGDDFWVTARRDDVTPRTALLLRTSRTASAWDAWELPRPEVALDHPGGLQSDGQRLWIPLSGSRRDIRSLIQAYRLTDLVPGAPARPEREFPVADHIGALAVDRLGHLWGASWDTVTVREWDETGVLKSTWSAERMRALGLGFAGAGSGLTVQDWKWLGGEIYATGLWKSEAKTAAPASRLLRFSVESGPSQSGQLTVLPLLDGVEAAREGMSLRDGILRVLPGDLGATNVLYQIPVTSLGKR
ncbi:MAG: hypothetical protein J0M24_16350 [Verrucomicrobia bacterium]|nr:hypothetical protein [Verrucomicrobiota bacterium]